MPLAPVPKQGRPVVTYLCQFVGEAFVPRLDPRLIGYPPPLCFCYHSVLPISLHVSLVTVYPFKYVKIILINNMKVYVFEAGVNKAIRVKNGVQKPYVSYNDMNVKAMSAYV